MSSTDLLPANNISAPPAVRATAVAKHEGDALLLAVIKTGDVAFAKEIIAMRDHERKTNALIAFNKAFADAKAKIKPIKKNRTVAFESKSSKSNGDKVSYNHEDLAAIADGVDEALSEYGLSYRFRPQEIEGSGGRFKLTCIISHRDGHFEETELPGSRDTSGMKNDLQGTMSTMTYLQRYTLRLALGLAIEGDDDGKSGGVAISDTHLISPAQLAELTMIADELKVDRVAFCALPTIKAESLAHIRAADFEHARATMEMKRKRMGAK